MIEWLKAFIFAFKIVHVDACRPVQWRSTIIYVVQQLLINVCFQR